MKLFCRLFGHTWVPGTEVPDLRWNTTDDGLILVPALGRQRVRHYEVCRRCGLERDLAPRRHDDDVPEGAVLPEDGNAR